MPLHDVEEKKQAKNDPAGRNEGTRTQTSEQILLMHQLQGWENGTEGYIN